MTESEVFSFPVSEVSNKYIQWSGGSWCIRGTNDVIEISLKEAAGNLQRAISELEQAQTRVESLQIVLKQILCRDDLIQKDPTRSNDEASRP
jgi:hypothetical protein